MRDAEFMSECIRLAEAGRGLVEPNPLVGAVLVVGDRVIGSGFHGRFGGRHAEVEAIGSVAASDLNLIPDAALYVSLEPCNHYGKTPPCTDLILKSGIKRVVIGSLDPNPLVSGRGMARLRESGVQVRIGILEKEVRHQNYAFFCHYERHRPFITLKWACSSDGFMAPADRSKMHLSNADADRFVHRLRAHTMAILVGGRTALIDDPQLTTRLYPGKNPLRIAVDTHEGLPDHLHIFDGSTPTLVFGKEPKTRLPQVEHIRLHHKTAFPQQVADALYAREIQSLLVEGGSSTLEAFYSAGLWDRIIVIQTPHLLERGLRGPEVMHMPHTEIQLGDNRILQFENPDSIAVV